MNARIGPYEVRRELGRGGMGVYEVRHPEIPRRLALKVIALEVDGEAAVEIWATAE